jgi:hypothetical protein
MSTIVHQASGASAYTRYHTSTFPSFESCGWFGRPDDSDHFGKDWSAITDELLRIRNLQDDWDGEGAEAPQIDLVDGAIALAQMLKSKNVAPPDRVHASVNGTVYFEWYSPRGYCEIEVLSPITAELRFVRKGSNTTEVVEFRRQV